MNSCSCINFLCGWTDEQRGFQARPGGWISPQPKAEGFLVGKGGARFLGSDPPSRPFLLCRFLFCEFFRCFLQFLTQKYPKLKVPNLDRGPPRSAGNLPTCTSFPSLPPSPLPPSPSSFYPSLPFPPPTPPPPLPLAHRSLNCALWFSSLQTPLLENCALRMFYVKGGGPWSEPGQLHASSTQRMSCHSHNVTAQCTEVPLLSGCHDVLQVSLAFLHIF